MKLYVLDSSEDTWLEIADTKYFEEKMSIKDLQEFYQNIFADVYIQDLLDKMENDNLIENSLSEEERKKDKEDWDNYRYTMQYIKNILESKMSPIEFKTFLDWCEKDLKNRMNKAQ